MRYSVGETDDRRPVAVVDSDILSGIDTSKWDKAKKARAKAAAKEALLAFRDGVRVNGVNYKVNRDSRREYTRSEYSENLAKRKPDVFADKMRAAANADDIITATTEWARDGELEHPRTDNLIDFDHGNVLIQAGKNQYEAETVVGITDSGKYVFYDVVGMKPTKLKVKEELSTTAAGTNATSDIQESSSDESVRRPAAKSNPQNAEKTKKSLKSDSRGRELTAAQQEYFEDSRVLDKSGKLLPVYHTTYDEFTAFERGPEHMLRASVLLLAYSARAAFSASTRSVFSQATPRSSRPM